MAYDRYVLNFASVDLKGHTETSVIRATDVLRKHGGEWTIVQEHLSVPFEYGTGKGDPMSRPKTRRTSSPFTTPPYHRFSGTDET